MSKDVSMDAEAAQDMRARLQASLMAEQGVGRNCPQPHWHAAPAHLLSYPSLQRQHDSRDDLLVSARSAPQLCKQNHPISMTHDGSLSGTCTNSSRSVSALQHQVKCSDSAQSGGEAAGEASLDQEQALSSGLEQLTLGPGMGLMGMEGHASMARVAPPGCTAAPTLPPGLTVPPDLPQPPDPTPAACGTWTPARPTPPDPSTPEAMGLRLLAHAAYSSHTAGGPHHAGPGLHDPLGPTLPPSQQQQLLRHLRCLTACCLVGCQHGPRGPHSMASSRLAPMLAEASPDAWAAFTFMRQAPLNPETATATAVPDSICSTGPQPPQQLLDPTSPLEADTGSNPAPPKEADASASVPPHPGGLSSAAGAGASIPGPESCGQAEEGRGLSPPWLLLEDSCLQVTECDDGGPPVISLDIHQLLRVAATVV
ncbi:hypothetical protein HaLaN_07212, partial [Haematococcus lacustris]